jgi:C4-type Zn-finger protein
VNPTTSPLDAQLAQLAEVLESSELLPCPTCGEQTLHVVDQVLLNVPGADEVEVRCLHCNGQSIQWLTH